MVFITIVINMSIRSKVADIVWLEKPMPIFAYRVFLRTLLVHLPDLFVKQPCAYIKTIQRIVERVIHICQGASPLLHALGEQPGTLPLGSVPSLPSSCRASALCSSSHTFILQPQSLGPVYTWSPAPLFLLSSLTLFWLHLTYTLLIGIRTQLICSPLFFTPIIA